MPITVPDFTESQTLCYVSILGVSTYDATISLQVTPDRLADWTDEELQQRVSDLQAALAAFCAVGTEVQAIVSWNRTSGVTTQDTSIPVDTATA